MTDLSPEEARARLLHATGFGSPFRDCRDLLDTLGCIQLDPLDRVGTNADLVAGARLPNVTLGDVYRETASYAFEHFAKERCLIAPRFFAHYRTRSVETAWWRSTERDAKLDDALIADVLAEVRDRGPVTTQQLADRGKTAPMDWSGWKGTSSLSSLATEALWARCEVVASGRNDRGDRLYDLPERALGDWASRTPEGIFGEEMIVERVRSAGLLSRNAGAHWSTLSKIRSDGTVEALLNSGRLVEYRVEKRRYLALPGASPPAPDVAPVVLGPLDALIWDRELVRQVFDFDYLWEVYKPAPKRVYGYYVCPVLAGERLIGRVEAKRENRPEGVMVTVQKRWGEVPDAALDRLAKQNRATLGWVQV